MFKKIKKNLVKRNSSRVFNDLTLAIVGLSLAYTISVLPAYSQQIIIDGKTNTKLNTFNDTTSVTTTTIKNNNAFNSFNKFNVNPGKIVNLVLPKNTENLINLIHSQATTIDGILNSIKDNRIGGNIYLVNPFGITVGSQGIINVGSLTSVTPTNDYINNFFSTTGEINEASVQALLQGNVPVNPEGEIRILGTINALESVKLDSGNIIHTGIINTGPIAKEAIVETEDLINVGNALDIKDLTYNPKSASITLKAKENVAIQGSLYTDGNNNLSAGNINITAGNDINLLSGSNISAKGTGENSNGGNIYIYANNDATFNSGAVIDARGGTISGDGGFIELSANNNVLLNGGVFKANAYAGIAGSILIDPDTIEIVADDLSDGASRTYEADVNILVHSGVTISTRNIADAAAGNHLIDASEGNSGDISFSAPEIVINPGARILSFADGSYSSGDITFTASQIEETDANARIEINSNSLTPTIVRGNNITLTAVAQDTYDVDFDDILTPAANATATAYIGRHAQVNASGNITIDTDTLADSKLIILTVPGVSEFNDDVTADAKPVSTSYIDEYANVTAAGDINIIAKADADSFVETIFFTPPANSIPEATAYIGNNAIVTSTGGYINISSESFANSFSLKTAKPSGSFSATDVLLGGAFSKANAIPEATSYIAGSALVRAFDVTNGDITVQSSTTATSSANSEAESYSSKESTIGAAIPIANAIPFSTTYIDNNATVNAGHNLLLGSSNMAEADAFGIYGTIATNDKGIGGAVAIANNTTNTLPGEIISAALGGLLSAPSNIIQCVKSDDFKDYHSNTYIGENTTITAGLNIDLNSIDDFSASSIAIGIAGSGKASIAGAVSYSDSNPITLASINDSASVTSTDGYIKINAESIANTDSNADAAAISSGDLGIGATVSISKSRPETKAYVDSDATLNALNVESGDIIISSSAEAQTDAISIGGAGAGSFAGGASVAVSIATPDAESYTSSGSNLTSGNNISLLSFDKSNANSFAIFGAAAKQAGAGATNATSLIDFGDSYNSNAYVGSDSIITAGNTLFIKTNDDEDEYDSKAEAQSIAGAIGGRLGLAGASSDSLIDSKTNASISNNATVNANNITISSRNNSEALASADSGAAGAYGGIGAAVTVTNSNPVATAYIGENAQVNATNDIEINSSTKTVSSHADDITGFNTIAGGGAGGFAGGASVAVSSAIPKTESYIGSNANVTAGNDIKIYSSEDTEAKATTGFAAIGGAAVGASVAVATTSNDETTNTNAYIDSGAIVTANNNIEIKTNKDATTDNPSSLASTHAIAGAGGGSLGLAASVATSTTNSSSQASVKDNATVTATNGSVIINSNNKNKTLASADSLAVSYQNSISAAVATTDSNPITKAFIGQGSTVNSGSNTEVLSINYSRLSYSNTITNTNALAGAGGGYFALGGAVSLNYADNETDAFIDQGAHINSSDNLLVYATDNTAGSLTSGNASIGGYAGLGATVLTTDLNNNTSAYIANNAEISVDNALEVKADSTDDTTAKTYSGQGGAVALGASVAITNSDNETNAYLESDSKIIKANDITINAISDSDVTTKAYGLTIGSIAVGAAYSEANSNGTTKAYIDESAQVGLDANPENTVGNINILATSRNDAEAYSKAGAGGVFSGNGSVAIAETAPDVYSYIDGCAQVTITGDLGIKSKVLDDATADAVGVSIGVGSAGVSWAEATLDPTIRTYIGSDAIINAQGDISLLSLHNYEDRNTRTNDKADAYSSGASAGYLIGANAAYSVATVDSSLKTYFAINADITGNDIELISLSNNIADDEATAKAGGFVAAGASISEANIDVQTWSYIDSNTNLNANNIYIKADAYNNAKADSTAGSGGVISGAASLAYTDIENDTKAYISDYDMAENKTITTNEDISIYSNSTSRYKAYSDSTIATLVGASGARADNEIDSDVYAYLGKNLSIDAGRDINIKAYNNVSRSGGGYDLEAGAGGFAGGPAGFVDTDIDITTKAFIKGNDTKDITKQINAGNNLTIDAINDVYTNESAKLTAGGAISWATVEVETSSDGLAHAYIGNNTLINIDNDLTLASMGRANVNTTSKAKSSGVAGVAKANSKSVAENNNLTEIHSGSEIYAGGDINILAGRSSDGTSNNIKADAESRAWASGGIPVTKVKAEANIDDYNDVKINSGTYVLSGQDMNIISTKGSHSTSAYAKGEMKTYLLFGIPITFTTNGTRDTDTDSSNNIALDGYIRSGLGSKRYLYIKRDGSIANFDELIQYKQDQLAGTDPENVEKYAGLTSDIAYLNALNLLDDEITTDLESIVMLETNPDETFNPRNYLIDQKADLQETLDNDSDLLTPEQISSINDNITDIDRQLENYEGKTDAEIELIMVPIDSIVVGSGKTNINGNLYGNGSINAPGNHFAISFMNDSIKNIMFDDLEIEKNVDGRIKINNSTITSNYGNISVNPGSSARKLIDIFNLFDPNDPRNPAELADKESHLLFGGDIFNLNGDIKIRNNSGNIVTYGLIKADSIEISGNADFIHNYTPGIYDTAGTNYVNPDPTPTIMAGNIIISAERININGLLQSGIDEYTLIIDEDFDPANDLYNEGSATDLIFSPDSNLKAYWDGEKIQVYRAETKGGYIELNGEIISTGNGRLKVLDGYGTINIINNSDKDIVINDLNINERVDGKIVIRDNQKYYYYTGSQATTRRANGEDSVVLRDIADVQLIESEITRDNNPGIYYPDPNAHITKPGVDVRYYPLWVYDPTWYNFYTISWWKLIFVPYAVPTYDFVAWANRPIGIEFSGRPNDGLINITSNNANVYIREDVSNITGNVNINALGLYNMNNTASVNANNINVNVVNGIGSETQALRTDLQNGVLTAISNSGLINIEEIQGDMNLGLVSTTDNVILTADGSIYSPDVNIASIRGKDFNLTSASGNIHAGIENNGAMTASANGDIRLNQLAGDLKVKTIESTGGGNVELTANGSILDVNENQEIVSTQELQDLWNEMELTGQAALDRIAADIEIYKQQKKQEYMDAHRLDENTFDDTYDPNYEYELTTEEQQAFDNSIWTEEELSNSINGAALPEEISQLEIPVIVEETNVTGNNMDLTALNGSIGLKKADIIIEKERFIANDLTADERTLLQSSDVKKILITDDSVIILSSDALNINNSGVLNAVSTDSIYIESDNNMMIDTITAPDKVSLTTLNGSIIDSKLSEEANILARTIALTSNTGSIGINNDDIDVSLTDVLELSSDDLIDIDSLNNILDITLYKGALSAKTRTQGVISITKPNSDLTTSNIGAINTLAGELNLTADNGSISLVNPDINAAILNLNSDEGGITLLMEFDPLITVNAYADIYINNTTGTLNINSIESTAGNAILIANNSILNGVITAGNIDLTATNGDIDTTIDLRNILTATALNNITLRELAGNMDINSVSSTSGNVSLIADNSIINGIIEGNNLTLTATNGEINTSIDSQAKLTATAEDDIEITELAGDMDINTVTSITGNATLTADDSIVNGSVRANDIRMSATNGEVNTTVDTDGKLTVAAEADINVTELTGDMDINTVTSASGDATLIADDSIINGTVQANDINLTATNGGINTSIDSNGTVTATANNDITLTELAGSMNLNTIASMTGNATLTADQSIINGTITTNNIDLTAINGLINTSVDYTQALNVYAQNDITLTKLSNGLIDSNIISIISNTGDVEINLPSGNIDLTRPDIQAVYLAMNATSGSIDLLIDFESLLNISALNDINVYKEPGSLNLVNINSLAGDVSLIADNSILNGVIQGNNINLTANNGEINTTMDSNGKLTATAQGNITLTELAGDMDINSILSLTGNTFLIADNSIINGLITSNDLDMHATQGEINTTTVLTGMLNAYANQGITLEELFADINLDIAQTNSGTVSLTAINGSINDTNGTNNNIIANSSTINAIDINDTLDFNVLDNTTINLTGDASIRGFVGDLTATTAGNFDSQELTADNTNLNVAGDVTLADTHTADFNVDAGGNFDSTNLTSGNTGLNITGDVTLADTHTADFNVDAGGNFDSTNMTSGNTGLDITGDVTLADTHTADFNVDAGGNFDSTNLTSGNTGLDITGDVTLADTHTADFNVDAGGNFDSTNMTSGNTGLNITGDVTLADTHTADFNVDAGGNFDSTNLTSGNTGLNITGDVTLADTHAADFNVDAGGNFDSTNLTSGNTGLNITGDVTLADTHAADFNVDAGGNFDSTNLTSGNTGLDITGDVNLADTHTADFNVDADGNFDSTNLTSGNTGLNITGDVTLADTHAADFNVDAGGNFDSTNLTSGNTGLDITGDVTLADTHTADFNVDAGGNFDSQNITADNANLYISGDTTLTDSVINNNFTVDIGGNLALENADIGSNLNAIVYQSADIQGRVGGAIDINAYILNLNLDSNINVSQIAVSKEANITSYNGGNILDADATENINIYAGNLNLISDGTIGESTNYLNVNVADITNALAEGSLYLKEKGSYLISDRIESMTGSAMVEATDTGATIKYISAPDVVSVKAHGNIDIDTLDPATVLLSATSGKTITVKDGLASDSVEIHADYVDVNFTDTSSDNSLSFNITGSNNSGASEVNINATSANSLVFTGLNSYDATLNNLTHGTTMTLENTTVTNQLNLQSDFVNAINNIQLNKLGAEGVGGTTANTINIANTGDLDINSINTQFATISTTGDNLSLQNAIITDTGTLSNSTYILVIENNGKVITSSPDIILNTHGLFDLTLDASINIVTTADVIAAAYGLDITGGGKQPEINNDMANVTSQFEKQFKLLLDKQNIYQIGESNIVSTMLGLDDPELYLDDNYSNYTYYFLNLALNAYNNAISHNETEEDALDKAKAILKNANFNQSIMEKILQKDSFKDNPDYTKLLEAFQLDKTANDY